jgi:hypothetical protein
MLLYPLPMNSQLALEASSNAGPILLAKFIFTVFYQEKHNDCLYCETTSIDI